MESSFGDPLVHLLIPLSYLRSHFGVYLCKQPQATTTTKNATRLLSCFFMAPTAGQPSEKPPSGPQPRIPLSSVSAPAQRLYVLSLGALLQVCCFLIVFQPQRNKFFRSGNKGAMLSVTMVVSRVLVEVPLHLVCD